MFKFPDFDTYTLNITVKYNQRLIKSTTLINKNGAQINQNFTRNRWIMDFKINIFDYDILNDMNECCVFQNHKNVLFYPSYT